MLKDLINQALNNARDGGYFNAEERNGMLYWGDLAIAQDLVRFDSDLENYQPTALIPFIHQWREQCGLLTPTIDASAKTEATKNESKSMSLEETQKLLNPLNRL